MPKNNPKLSSNAEGVTHGEDLKPFIRNMFQTVEHWEGLGLAANQVGSLDRVIVINTRNMQQAIINPVITKKYSHTGKNKEGCLSYPNLFISRRRTIRIIVEGYDENWKPVKLKLKKLESFVVQHEIDHLNGITIGNFKANRNK